MFAPSISSWVFVTYMLREIHSRRECSNMRKIGGKKKKKKKKKKKHPTFIFSVIRSRMFARFIYNATHKHPTFIFSAIRSRMFARFISDGKRKHPTFSFSDIHRMFARFISDGKRKCTLFCYFSAIPIFNLIIPLN